MSRNRYWPIPFVLLVLLFACSRRHPPVTTSGKQPTVKRQIPQQLKSRSRGVEQTANTKWMVAVLKGIAENADPEKNPSIPRHRKLMELRNRLQSKGSISSKVIVNSHIAFQLMLNGQNELSVKEFDKTKMNLGLIKLPADSPFFTNFRELIGLANLRLAEEQNCILNHGRDSCIVPIVAGGIHQKTEGAIAARREFLHLLEKDPNDLKSRWLLNIACMVLGEYPNEVPSQFVIPPSTFTSTYDIGRFTDVAGEAGVATVGLSGGVVMDDFDGDGHLDLMTSDWGIDKQLRLYRNKGDGTFQESTQAAGLDGEVGGLNLVQADYDNDGNIDVLVLRGAWLGKDGEFPNSLLRNLGDGRFDDVTQPAGLFNLRPTQAAAWADYDLDGLLDLFIGNESRDGTVFPCQMYRNNGDGTFTDVASQVGLAFEAFVKGVTWIDFNHDRRPDLFVSCFGQPNRLYQNESISATEVRFVEVGDSAGIREPSGSFATWSWDFDNDGWNDILVAPFLGFKFDGSSLRSVVSEYLGKKTDADRIHLYQNNRNGTFTNVAPKLGLDAPLLAMGANFGDLDNDGFLDCYFGTGDPHFSTLVPNRMFRNDGGQRFDDVTTSGGFGHIQKGHGIAFGDIDNDGDQDIFSVMGGAIAGDVFQNVLFKNPGHGNHWVTLKLLGTKSNRSAIGAKICVTLSSPQGRREIFVTVNSGGSFGASSLQQEIGLGSAQVIQKLEILWPLSSEPQVFENVAADRTYEVREGEKSIGVSM